jgi:hypothetical protein
LLGVPGIGVLADIQFCHVTNRDLEVKFQRECAEGWRQRERERKEVEGLAGEGEGEGKEELRTRGINFQ